MNGKMARRIRNMTKVMLPDTDGTVEYENIPVDVNVMKRMDLGMKYAKKEAKRLGMEFTSSSMPPIGGDKANRITVSRISRRYYNNINKCKYKGGDNCEK